MKLDKNIKLFGLYGFFDGLDFYVPLKILYLYQLTGSYSVAASIISFAWIFAAVMEVPTGVFSDFVGRKRTMVLGAACITTAYAMYALGFNYWILILGAFLEGCSRAFYSGNNHAFLHDTLAENGNEAQFHKYYGRINSYLTIATFVAALTGGFIAGFSYAYIMWLSVITQLLAFITILFVKDVPIKTKESTNVYAHIREAFSLIKQNLNLRYLSLANIFGGAGQAAYEFQIAVVNSVWPTWALGLFRAFQELSVMPGYFFANKIIDRFGAANVVIWQSISSWAGNIISIILRSGLSPFFIAFSLLFYGPADTGREKLIQKEFTDSQRATSASINSLGSSLYMALVAYIAGVVATLQGPFMGFLTTQIFFLPVIYFQWKLIRRIKLVNSSPAAL